MIIGWMKTKILNILKRRVRKKNSQNYKKQYFKNNNVRIWSLPGWPPRHIF